VSRERLQNQALTVVKSVDKGIIQSSVTVNSYGSLQFLLSDLNEVASYTAIFDQYRITSITLEFLPCSTAAVPNATASSFTPVMYTAIDYDDNGVPSSLATVLNYANVRYHQCGSRFKMTFKPHIAVAGYTGTFGGYVNIPAPWIDAASTNVQHYGVKYAMPTALVYSSWQCIARYTCQFRNIR
jgi:hypothetical protein